MTYVYTATQKGRDKIARSKGWPVSYLRGLYQKKYEALRFVVTKYPRGVIPRRVYGLTGITSISQAEKVLDKLTKEGYLTRRRLIA